jgi:hypothetical protein
VILASACAERSAGFDHNPHEAMQIDMPADLLSNRPASLQGPGACKVLTERLAAHKDKPERGASWSEVRKRIQPWLFLPV